MKTYITNSFSINMLLGLGANNVRNVRFAPISVEDARNILNTTDELICGIGHADTAAVVGSQLGLELTANRLNVVLGDDVQLVVAQYTGPRLPEGVTKLPQGASIRYWMVTTIQ